MTFATERRRLLGWLAILAPLPLPFNEILEWPVLVVYWTTIALLLARSARGADTRLPNWAMNLAGLAYLPVFWIDGTLFWRGQLLRPMLHLAMFALVVKLFALKRDRDAWQAFLGSLFLALAAMGTSVHPSMMLYLAVILFMHLLVLARFTAFHLLDRFEPHQGSPSTIPLTRFLALTVALTLLGSAPIFVILPRIRTPFISTSRVLGQSGVRGGGVSQAIGLDSTSRSRTNRSVALRFSYETQGRELPEVRFKLATYDRFTGSGWRLSRPGGRSLRRGREGLFRLAPGRYSTRLRVWQLPVATPELAIPVQTVTVDLPVPTLIQGRDGSVFLPRAAHSLLEYVVGLTGRPVSGVPPPETGADDRPTLDRVAIDPRIADLAKRIAGDGLPRSRAERIELELSEGYGYTLDRVGRGGADPIGRFLFVERRGHCELFASSMVLMLRSVEIPARFVVGYLGAEKNRLEDYWVVRQSHRHAWVEAYLPGEGWQVFDPTPAVGLPGVTDLDLAALVDQAWDYFSFRWDRYVLTYGFGDQLDLVFGFRSILDRIWPLLGLDSASSTDAGSTSDSDTTPVAEESPAEERTALAKIRSAPVWLPFVFLLLLILLWVSWQGRWISARMAWRKLRRRLRSSGLEVPDSVPPEEVHRRLTERFPEAAAPAGRVLRFYLRESFGEEELEETEGRALKAELEETLRALRRVR